MEKEEDMGKYEELISPAETERLIDRNRVRGDFDEARLKREAEERAIRDARVLDPKEEKRILGEMVLTVRRDLGVGWKRELRIWSRGKAGLTGDELVIYNRVDQAIIQAIKHEHETEPNYNGITIVETMREKFIKKLVQLSRSIFPF